MPEIGIVETRNIIRAIQQKYDYDFSKYTLTAFRFALDRSILRHHLRYPELLATRILEDDDFFDEFLFDINDSSVELFRDADSWSHFKSKILPGFFETFSKPKIWLPGVSNGQDFFSILMILNREFPDKKISMYITTSSQKIINTISKGYILAKQLESGHENFEKVFPDTDISKFLRPNGKDYIIESSNLLEIIFRKQNLLFEPLPESADMIFFRNKLINYNSEYQKYLLDRLVSRLQINGYLIIGIKENIEEYISEHMNLKLIDKNEKVFRKIK